MGVWRQDSNVLILFPSVCPLLCHRIFIDARAICTQTETDEICCEKVRKMAHQSRLTRLDQSVIEPLSCASLAYSDNGRRGVKYKSRSIG